MADQSISLDTGATIEGRLLARIAAVTIDVCTITIPASASGIENDQNILNGFELLQNYPNPFNPTTLIQYNIETNSQVSLKVFDMLGQEVATLVDGYQNAGKYSVEFGTNNGSVNLSSGVYYYKLEAGSFSSMKKMMLIK